MKLDLTKGLDKVEATTGRINTIIKTRNKTLEIIKHNITKGVKDRIGLAHKNTTFGNIMPHSLQDTLTCPRVSIESVVCLLLTTFRLGCMLRNIRGPTWLGSAHA